MKAGGSRRFRNDLTFPASRSMRPSGRPGHPWDQQSTSGLSREERWTWKAALGERPERIKWLTGLSSDDETSAETIDDHSEGNVPREKSRQMLAMKAMHQITYFYLLILPISIYVWYTLT